jgi:hypothetical protein
MSADVPAGVRKTSSNGMTVLTRIVIPSEARDLAVGAAS